ncbi:MAG TPA: septation protein SepH, partial [Rugosimonospora sp.]|nr:septation protein SepH [Rugosimonospora sp.]
MRPVRFVALSEDGQAFVLADEVGRLLALPIDERIHGVLRKDGSAAGGHATTATAEPVVLSPRDIQAKIRAGESADEVARLAGVPVDKVLRYAGPVLQERAMLAQHARRTKLRSSSQPGATGAGASLADVVDSRLAQHGVEAEKIAWDAYRRDDGTWRIVATWPSGKATAQAVWELDRTRQSVSPHDDMARYLCTERPQPVAGMDTGVDRPGRGLGAVARPEPTRPELPGHGRELPAHGREHGGRGGHEPMRPPTAEPARRDS